MSNWKDKVAVITGAGSGIGAALAKHCAAQGMHVIAADIDEPGLAQTRQAIGDRDQQTHIQSVDVRDEHAIEALAAFAFEQFGQVNLLFNNAGVLVDGKTWERSIEDWRWNFEVNVIGVVNGIRSFVPRMLQQNTAGTIVNTASIGGLIGGGPFLAPYQGTKHAVVAITESLRGELCLEPGEISAACLCPGDTATGIWESERHKSPAEQHQLGTDAERTFHDVVAGMCAQGFTPEQAAASAFAGIEAGKFWLFPQPEFKELFKPRVQHILDETVPPSPAESMKAFM